MSTLAIVPLLGKHLSSVVWTPQSLSGATLSDTTPVQTFSMMLEEIQLAGPRYTLEQIVPMDSPRDNPVQISVGMSVRFVEILQNLTSGANLTAIIGTTGGYWKMTTARAGKTWTLTVLVEDYEETHNRGGSRGVLTAQIVDIGSSSIGYA